MVMPYLYSPYLTADVKTKLQGHAPAIAQCHMLGVTGTVLQATRFLAQVSSAGQQAKPRGAAIASQCMLIV